MSTELIAKTFQGLEPLLAQELTELGADDVQIGRRMVSFKGDKELMYRANFCLRTAIRVLKPIKHFKARSADDVYAQVKAIDWSKYLSPDNTFAVDSVVFSQEFHHSKFVAYKVKDAIADQFREQCGRRPNVSVANPDIQLHIHIAEDDATLALDSSGESLHRRGYRQETVAAPLNEVLAAAIIMMTGWNGQSDFLDPFCGSGTFCIEAALIARGIAPGVFRTGYAFEKWADFDPELLQQVYNDDSAERPFDHHIYGRDIDPKAVALARRNVRAAGLSKDITISEADFRTTPLLPLDIEADSPLTTHSSQPPMIVTNPPYGERVSSPDLLGLYKAIGQKLKHEHTGGEAWVLSYHEECFDEIGLKPSLKTPLYNGSLECELRKYVLFSGKLDQHRATGGQLKTDDERRQMAEKRRFKQKRDSFRRNREDDDADESSNQTAGQHRFNKYSKNDDFKGHKRPFRSRDEERDGDRGGDRDERYHRAPRRRDDYRQQGQTRSDRQAARRRFFGGGDNKD